MSDSAPVYRSATSPLHYAGNTTLYYCSISNNLPSVSDLVGLRNNSEYCLHPGIRLTIQLCLMYSMRIGETLAITPACEVKPSVFLCRALKRGHAYTISIPIDARNRQILSRMHPSQKILPFAYHTVWRSMVRTGMSLRVTGRLNRAVTHMGRFKLAEKLAQLNEIDAVTSVLHHRASTSREYYLPAGSK